MAPGTFESIHQHGTIIVEKSTANGQLKPNPRNEYSPQCGKALSGGYIDFPDPASTLPISRHRPHDGHRNIWLSQETLPQSKNSQLKCQATCEQVLEVCPCVHIAEIDGSGCLTPSASRRRFSNPEFLDQPPLRRTGQPASMSGPDFEREAAGTAERRSSAHSGVEDSLPPVAKSTDRLRPSRATLRRMTHPRSQLAPRGVVGERANLRADVGVHRRTHRSACFATDPAPGSARLPPKPPELRSKSGRSRLPAVREVVAGR